MYPYITVWKNNKYVGIFYNNDIKDTCEDLQKSFSKDCVFKIKYSNIKFKQSKKDCSNNFDEIEKDLNLK